MPHTKNWIPTMGKRACPVLDEFDCICKTCNHIDECQSGCVGCYLWGGPGVLGCYDHPIKKPIGIDARATLGEIESKIAEIRKKNGENP